MLRRFTIWLFERAIESSLAAMILRIVYGSSDYSRLPGWVGDFYVGFVSVVFFYVASGYIFSTILVGVLARPRRLIHQCGLMALCFLGHFGLFILMSGGGIERPVLLAGLGVSIVIFATFLGGAFLARWSQNLQR